MDEHKETCRSEPVNTPAMTEVELNELAECMAVTVAPWLALAVHVRNPQLVNELLGRLDRQRLLALAVVLASQIGKPRTRFDDGVIDEVAIQRAVNGEQLPLTTSERAQAVLILARRGETQSVIAKRLHMSGKAILRLLNPTAPQADEESA